MNKFLTKRKVPLPLRMLGGLMKAVLVSGCVLLAGLLLVSMLGAAGPGTTAAGSRASNVSIMDRFDMFIINRISNSLEGIVKIEKIYWLSDHDEVAPKPKADHFGTVDDPAELTWLIQKAARLINGRELSFHEDIPIWEHSQVHYYYDETILVIFWQQLMDGIVHNVAEVFVADASQLRRGLAGGEFGSDKQFVPSQIAQSVNSVVATSGDFYKFRQNGIIVHKGQLRRFDGKSVDTCFINDQGELLFVKRGELTTEAEAQKYIEDHNVRFSLAFGPVMVENGENVVPPVYPIGEINKEYTRAAVCQLDQLHYLFVNTSSYMDHGLTKRQTLKNFADNLIELGADKAYALDGGQTTVIAINGQLVTSPDYEAERQISDIIYFATALPDGE